MMTRVGRKTELETLADGLNAKGLGFRVRGLGWRDLASLLQKRFSRHGAYEVLQHTEFRFLAGPSNVYP